jgi:predicted RNase H-like HicB family nuclease
MQIFTAVIHRKGDIFVAECPEVGTVSLGGTIAEALVNLKEATELYLEEFSLEIEPERSIVTTFKVAGVAKT